MAMPASAAPCSLRPGDRHAVQLDGAAVRLIHAGDEVHERRLAGAVLADQRVHLAAPDLEGDVIDGPDAREGLDHIAHGQARPPGTTIPCRPARAATVAVSGLLVHAHLERWRARGPSACGILATSGATQCIPLSRDVSIARRTPHAHCRDYASPRWAMSKGWRLTSSNRRHTWAAAAGIAAARPRPCATAVAPSRLRRGGARPAAPVYDWFTEGFDTADLKDARALLDELA